MPGSSRYRGNSSPACCRTGRRDRRRECRRHDPHPAQCAHRCASLVVGSSAYDIRLCTAARPAREANSLGNEWLRLRLRAIFVSSGPPLINLTERLWTQTALLGDLQML